MALNAQAGQSPASLLFFGTYDRTKVRVRILQEAARAAGMQVAECHEAIWDDILDKSIIRKGKLLGRLLKGIALYPRLALRYLRSPAHDTVVLSYPGYLDMFVLWPLARLRGKRIVWDVFISPYEMLCENRKLIAPRSLAGRLIYGLEWVTYRMADTLFMDTHAHARYLEKCFHLRGGDVGCVWVGAEPAYFKSGPATPTGRAPGPFMVLFYGQFIPLHGVDIIVQAARILAQAGENVVFSIVGNGQEAARIDRHIESDNPGNIRRTAWLPYAELAGAIAQADVCLGVFGTHVKASYVIPNKIFQALACRKPIITLDSPTIRELLTPSEAIHLIPAGDAGALARAILALRDANPDTVRLALEAAPVVTMEQIGMQLCRVLGGDKGEIALPEHAIGAA